jgi:hypothetical protein
MTVVDDALAIRQAVIDAGEPLTLTEAGHATSMTRWRSYRATKYGVQEGGLSYVRDGAHYKIDNELVDPYPAPAAPTVTATATELTITWVPPVGGDGNILQYGVSWQNTTTPAGPFIVTVAAPDTSVVIPNGGEWLVGETLSATVVAQSIAGNSPASPAGTGVAA